MRKNNHNSFAGEVRTLIGLVLFSLLFSLSSANAQDKNTDQNYQTGTPYSISDIESINLTNGNLMFNFDFGSVKGRGLAAMGYALKFNSKVFETHTMTTLDSSGNNVPQIFLREGTEGGWMYDDTFRLKVISRNDDLDQPIQAGGGCNPPNKDAVYLWKVQMYFPDGSQHEFRPAAYSDSTEAYSGNGYYNVNVGGLKEELTSTWLESSNCPGGIAYTVFVVQSQTSAPKMVYYSSDGTHMRLEIPTGQDARNPASWTLYMPDGSKVEQTQEASGNLLVKNFDRHGNFVVKAPVTLPDSSVAGGWVDELGRYVAIKKNVLPKEDRVYRLGVNGELLTWKVKWKTISVIKPYTTSGVGSGQGRGGTSSQVLQAQLEVVERIELPSQLGAQSFTFNYAAHDGVVTLDPNNPNYSSGWGELIGITLPSGATVDYEYAPIIANGASAMVPLLGKIKEKTLNYETSYDGVAEQKSESWLYWIGSTSASVTGPDGGVSQQFFHNTSYDNEFSGKVYKEIAPDGTVTERIWQSNKVAGCTPDGCGSMRKLNHYVKTEFTSIPDGNGLPSLTAIRDFEYDKNGNLLILREYDWIPYATIHQGGFNPSIPSDATPKRTTYTSYYNATGSASDSQTNSPNAYWNSTAPRVLDAEFRTQIDNASVTEVSYDNPYTTANPTMVRTWDSTKGPLSDPLTTGNSIATTTQYDSYGNAILSTDPKGTQTQITYGPVNGFSGLYPTETKSAYNTAIQQTVQSEYDFNTGLTTRTTSLGNLAAENVVSETEYDAIGRAVKVKTAVGTPLEVWSTTEYNDTLRRVIVRSDIETKGDGKKIAVQHFDQLGRVRLTRQIENVLTEDPANETHGIKTQTRYLTVQNVGEYELTSNPYRAATSNQAVNEPTMGWKVEFESKAGDVSTSETFSGVSMPAPWGNNSNSTGIGKEEEDTTATITTDERGKKRRTISDGLGRLIRVDEPNENNDLGPLNNPTQATFFTHDTLGNLTQIVQGEQTRVFTYSSLSRLVSSTNPESGTFQFVYDAAGNLLSKTDARSVSTTYTYDALNRATFRDYSDATPDIGYVYDEPTVPYSKGKLTKISSSVAETRYTAFDAANRVISSRQVIDGNNYEFGYTYYLGGQLKTQTYPSGKIVKFEYSNDDELAQVSNQLTGKVYANSFAYSAHGQVEKMRLGNGRWETTRFNGALQITEIGLGYSATDTGLWKANYEYGDWETGALNQQKNNGNLARQTISVPTIGQAVGFTAVQTYSYDSLDRLKSAEETVGGSPKWKQSFLYDRYTNRNLDTANTTLQSVESNIPKVANPQILTFNNRYKQDQDNDGQPDFLYDESGNLTKDSQNRYFAYDAENRQKTATGNSLSMSYLYDGSGKRVKTVNAITNQTTIFVYDTDGDLAAEYTINVPAPQSPTVSYLTEDALGSVRVTTNSFGDVQARRDFLPFGEELHAGIGNRTSNQKYSSIEDDTRKKFATYQRDSETKLDFAQSRYYSPMQGRFTSPDEFKGGPDELFDFEEDASDNPTFYADLENPQSLNKYQYTYNNPYKYNDPSGHCPPLIIAGIVIACLLNPDYAVAPTGNETGEQMREYRSTNGGKAIESLIPLPIPFFNRVVRSVVGGTVTRSVTKPVTNAVTNGAKNQVKKSATQAVKRSGHEANVKIKNAAGKTISKSRVKSGNMTAKQKAMKYPKGQLASHTEAKAVTQNKLKSGQKMVITGKKRPCPSCKGFMNRATKQSGATVRYQWRQNGRTQRWQSSGGKKQND